MWRSRRRSRRFESPTTPPQPTGEESHGAEVHLSEPEVPAPESSERDTPEDAAGARGLARPSGDPDPYEVVPKPTWGVLSIGNRVPHARG